MSHVTDSLERPIRDLRISVTDRCNLRCPYCMPAEVFGEKYAFLQRDELLTFEEIERVARLFAECGVSKLRVTGGEPLLRQGLDELISRLARIDGIDDLTLTTNGLLLGEHARRLADAGLSRVTVSLDSLDPTTFRKMSGRDHDPERVLAGIEAAAAAGLTPIKINCVVRRGVNEQSILPLAEHFRGTPHILRFIEFMDVGTLNGWNLDEVVPAQAILDGVGERWPLVPVAASYRGEVARRYRYEDGAGEIGVIASVTAPFCGDCTRARLSTKGEIVTCLFASEGTDLRVPLRGGASDDALLATIRSLWSRRADRYSELRSENTSGSDRIEMFRIGG